MSLLRKFGFEAPDVGGLLVSSVRADPGIRTLEVMKRSLLQKAKTKKERLHVTPETNPAFSSYARASLERMDTMIDLLSSYLGSMGRDIRQESQQSDVVREEKKKSGNTGLGLLAGLAGAIALDGWKYLVQPVLKAIGDIVRFFTRLIERFTRWLSNMVRSIRGAISRITSSIRSMVSRARNLFTRVIPRTLQRFYTSMKNGMKSAIERLTSSVERLIIRPLRSMIGSAGRGVARFFGNIRNGLEGAWNRVAGAFERTGARAATRVVSINRLGSLGTFFRTLGVIGRRIPLIASLITPLIEGIESNNEIKALADRRDAGEITEEQFRQQAAESGIGAVMDTLGIMLGSAGGAILGSFFGPGIGTFIGGVLGGLGGQMLSDLLKPLIAPTLARAFVSGEDAAVRLAQQFGDSIAELQEMLTPEAFVERVRSFNPMMADTIQNFINSGEEHAPARTPAAAPQAPASHNMVPTPTPQATPAMSIPEDPEVHNSTNVAVNNSRTNVINTREVISQQQYSGGSFNLAAGYN